MGKKFKNSHLSFQRKLESKDCMIKMDSSQRKVGFRWNDKKSFRLTEYLKSFVFVCISFYSAFSSADTDHHLFVSQLTAEKGGENFQIIPYDSQSYELAYQIFLQNQNVQDAFAIAYAAAKQQPMDLTWQHRLITVAIWNSQPVIALDQYVYLADRFHDQQALTTGAHLARKIHEDVSLSQFLALDIKRGAHNLRLWNEYIKVLIRIGELQIAINQLINHQYRLPQGFYLPKLIRLYGYIEELTHQQSALYRYRTVVGITPYVAVTQTALDMTTGNVAHAYQQLHAAKGRSRNNDRLFWNTYAQMSWLNNQNASSIEAYKKLLRQPKPKAEVYERLVSLYIQTRPDIAYYYARLGVAAYPGNLLLTQSTLTLMTLLGRFNEMAAFNAIIPLKVQAQLYKDSNYWLLRGTYLQQRASLAAVLYHYQQVIAHFPESDALQADYLSFLLQNNQLFLLSPWLAYPPADMRLAAELWPAYAAGYAHTANRTMTVAIVSLYSSEFPRYQNNPYWLINYKDFLEQTFMFNRAVMVSHYAWPLYLHLLNTQNQPPDYEQLIDYAKLAVDEAPGDVSARVLALFTNNLTPESAELIFSWALSQKNYPLAALVYTYYLQRGWLPPPALSLTLALYYHNNYLLRSLLLNNTPVLPAEDRIQAAQDIGAISLSQNLAYQGLAEQPQNSDLYDHYFTPIMLKYTDNINFRQQYYQFGTEEGPRTLLDVTYRLTPGTALVPYASTWFLTDISKNDLASVPPRDDRAGLQVKSAQPHGDLLLDLGYRNNLAAFATAKITKNYAITHNLNALFTAGYNQQADDTSALLIGGNKQDLLAQFSYDLTARDSFQGEYEQNFFYTQDGEFLANGQQQTLRFKHQFQQAYPDWSLGVYGTAAQYYNLANSISGSALTLIPTGTAANANFFIPPSFIEYGATAEFGQNFREDYTHTWKPFAAVTVMNNNTVGFGQLYDVGIAGTLFGKDHLAFYYEEGVNQGAGVSKSQLFEVMYQFYW